MAKEIVMVTPNQANALEEAGIDFTYFDVDALVNGEEKVEIEFETETSRVAALKIINQS